MNKRTVIASCITTIAEQLSKIKEVCQDETVNKNCALILINLGSFNSRDVPEIELSDIDAIDKDILDNIDASAGGLTDDPMEDTENPVDLDDPEVDYQPDITLQNTGEVIE